MARGVTIKFQGGEELRKKFMAMVDGTRAGILDEAVRPAAGIVREAIFAIAPVDTGKLASNMALEVAERSENRFVMHLNIHKDAFYWRFIEFGWEHRSHRPEHKLDKLVPAKPFIRPAFYSSRTQARNEVRDGIRDLIDGFTV